MENVCLVYVTATDAKEAARIGDEVVSSGLAACVNIISKISSIYMWGAKKQKGEEAVIILKTRVSRLKKLEKAIKKIHSYECPCIIALPAVHVNKDYAEWIMSVVK